jgi:lipoate-protein ligase A
MALGAADLATHETWRYIDSGPLPGAQNMATDEAMLEAHLGGETPPTLRAYTWRPPAISLGRFQQVETSVNVEECRRAGIDVVRRPTGGRAILHTEEEVTFSIVVSEARLGTQGVMHSYRALASAIVAGLKHLGLDARLVERSFPSGPSVSQDPACFAAKARCDLVVGSSKVVGSAQVHRDGVILQQNSLPLRIHVADWQRFFLRRSEAPAAVGVWEAVGAEVPYARVAQALRCGFEETLGIDLVDSELTAGESARATRLAARADLLRVDSLA